MGDLSGSHGSGGLVIETTALRKEFTNRHGTRVAVDDLHLAVPAGGVHGFLGPNGSGKTTTINAQGFDEDDPECVSEKARSFSSGVTYYGVLLGAVTLASAGSFRRRDVP